MFFVITLFSGTPGSGKSLRVAKNILEEIRFKKRNVICINMNVNPDYAIRSSRDGRLMFCHDYSLLMNPEPLYAYAKQFHEVGRENQTLLVFDEVQDLLSTSAVRAKKKLYGDYLVDWLTFFSQHRHLGYEVYLITQYDRMIHPDIRFLIEYEFAHRKLRNAGDFGFFLAFMIRLFTGKEIFIQIRRWKVSHERLGSSFYTYSKKYNQLYDSYKKFRDLAESDSGSVQALDANRVSFIEQRKFLDVELQKLDKKVVPFRKQEEIKEEIDNEKSSVI